MEVSLIASPSGASVIVYLILPPGVNGELRASLDDAAAQWGCHLALIDGVDWNDNLTPWPAPGVFRKAKPFGGNAAGFLKAIEDEAVPYVEACLGVPERRVIAGISLSGLFAVWAALQTSSFDAALSISGSLWYDGFEAWVRECAMQQPRKFVFILGDREKNSKETRMACVEDATSAIAEALASKGHKVSFELVEGTHFSPSLPRLQRAMELLQA